MGMGGLGNRGPVTKFEKFSQAEAPPRAKEKAGKQQNQTSQAPRKRKENFGGLDGLVNVY